MNKAYKQPSIKVHVIKCHPILETSVSKAGNYSDSIQLLGRGRRQSSWSDDEEEEDY